MDQALVVPLIARNILSHLTNDRIHSLAKTPDPSDIREKYILASTCRMWREILRPHMYDHFYYKFSHNRRHTPRYSADQRDLASTSQWGTYYSTSTQFLTYDQQHNYFQKPRKHAPLPITTTTMLDGCLLCQTNARILPEYAQPRHITLHLNASSIITLDFVNELTQSVFPNTSWPLARGLTIMSETPFEHRVPIEELVGALVSRFLSIVSITLRPSDRGPSRASTISGLHGHSDRITALDLGSNFMMFDLNSLRLRSLASLSLQYDRAHTPERLPVINPRKVKHLKLVDIHADMFFGRFDEDAVEDTVVFSQLETLDIKFFEVRSAGRGQARSIKYRFPKLRHLALDSESYDAFDVHSMIQGSPLEYLKLIGDDDCLHQLDLSLFPTLAYATILEGTTRRPRLSSVDISRNLIRPESKIRELTLCSVDQASLLGHELGCKSLRHLEINDDIGFGLLKHIVQQLPILLALDVLFPLTSCEDMITQQVIWRAVITAPSTPLNSSLQILTLRDSYQEQLGVDGREIQPKYYSTDVVSLIVMLVRIPLLRRMTFFEKVHGKDEALIRNTFTDPVIQDDAPHFRDTAFNIVYTTQR
ncbi:hypothetical protein DL89DRAFT_267745 [Linderina pennispora]|uniref:F-box domain-containing protein n=1 Tax=Linderina pennispora TaxID=61395 RepID=A0A1Y1W7R7_9FUNG|nr:uncharacterized protein DL89DRAFT_267745 [Linderina pennispora]ORX69557.1 hypothetical protein DL89DRAFT_267745 [Linderina pennispora]